MLSGTCRKTLKFPLSDKVILHAKWDDVGNRIDAKWKSVEFYVNSFEPDCEKKPSDKLYHDFCDYHIICDE